MGNSDVNNRNYSSVPAATEEKEDGEKSMS